MVDRVRRVPPWAWLTVIVAGSIVVRAWLGSRMPAPFIFTDELQYQENARSLAAGAGHPGAGRGVRDRQRALSAAARPGVPALRLAAGRLCSGPDDQRRHDVARCDPCVHDRAAAAAAGPVPARGAARGRAPVARLHRHADVRERLLSRVPARGVGALARPGRADAAAAARPARGLRRGHARARAGSRRGPRRADRAPASVAGRAQTAAAVGAALRGRRRRRGARARRATRARCADLEPVRRLPGRRRGELRRRRRAQVPLLAPRRARPLRRCDPVRRVPAARRPHSLARASRAGVRHRDRLLDGLDADHRRRVRLPFRQVRSSSETCSCSRRCS